MGSWRGSWSTIDLFFSTTLANAILGLSIWIMDGSIGKNQQFSNMGDETTSGYLAFIRIWISTLAVVFGPGHVSNVPVGIFALLWNIISVLNSFVFFIIVGTYVKFILKGFYGKNVHDNSDQSKRKSDSVKYRVPAAGALTYASSAYASSASKEAGGRSGRSERKRNEARVRGKKKSNNSNRLLVFPSQFLHHKFDELSALDKRKAGEITFTTTKPKRKK